MQVDGLKKSTPKEPWKPLVFKMPQKKPPRQLDPDDDGFTTKMRERLKALKLKDEKATNEARAVSETKVDDLIAKEADDAKINGLYTMWYLDKEADKARRERDSPDLEVLKKRFDSAKLKLEQPVVKEVVPETTTVHRGKRGYLELPDEINIEELLQARQARSAAHSAHESTVEEREQDEGIADYLTNLQKKSKKLDGISRRVVKSPEDRKQDYEATKGRMTAITATLGILGSILCFFMYGINVAFSFGLGSIGALSYLSGLSAYTDNAETPMAQVTGGRRLLVPVVVVLLVTGWPKIEAQIPAIAELHLEPSLLPAILGLFLYTAGKVLGAVLK